MSIDGFTEGSNPACQHVDPLDDTARRHQDERTCSGDILARFTPDDPQSGIDYITVPAGPAGWTPNSTTQVPNPGPYDMTYAWATAASNFNTRNATSTSLSGQNSTNTPFTITTDNGNPGGGGISYTTGWNTSSPITLTITNYTDTGSGIYHQQVLRDEVPRTAANNCNNSERGPGRSRP